MIFLQQLQLRLVSGMMVLVWDAVFSAAVADCLSLGQNVVEGESSNIITRVIVQRKWRICGVLVKI